jgi:hypothetical protein
MSKSDAYESDLQKFTFNETAVTGITSTLYVSLHTADPTDAGSQTSSECAYTSYARVAVARTSGEWVESNGTVNPVNPITFPTATGGSETATHFAIGTAASGAGKVLYHGTITPNITITNGVTPELTTATAITED